MKIVVCAKFVPDATADRRFRSEDKTVDRAGVDGLLSELDEYAVETALTELQKKPDDASRKEALKQRESEARKAERAATDAEAAAAEARDKLAAELQRIVNEARIREEFEHEPTPIRTHPA